MNSTFSTDLVAPWTEDSKALLEKLWTQWRTAVTLHRGQTQGSAPSHIKLNYGKIFLCILVHLLALIRLKSHQSPPVQSYLCSWALQSILCQVLPLSGLTVKSSLELGPAGSETQFGLSGGLSSQMPHFHSHLHTLGPGTGEYHFGNWHKCVFCERQVSTARMVLKSICSARQDRLSKLSLFHSIMWYFNF